ncbi:hypothetical protein CPB86DRAFT_351176 [Serendipita vermifera]|nr:hypothetical protein CPB86DRAFT_351176 [Serendipita vermifera]
MPPPNDSPAYHLIPHPKPLYVYQLGANTTVPPSLLQSLQKDLSFKSITWTKDEISIVTDLPPKAFEDLQVSTPDTLLQNGPDDWEYIALAIRGPMDLSLTGILCGLITPLQAAKVPVFTLATWNTDYLLIPSSQKDKTYSALRTDGWTIVQDEI